LVLIDKGLSRQKAYELVQKNAMKAWKGGRSFSTLLKHDSEVMAVIKPEELESLFDYQYYLGHVNEIFKRLGLTEAQWRDKSLKSPVSGLTSRSIQSN
jgi:adenylosuccinate lyase